MEDQVRTERMPENTAGVFSEEDDRDVARGLLAIAKEMKTAEEAAAMKDLFQTLWPGFWTEN